MRYPRTTLFFISLTIVPLNLSAQSWTCTSKPKQHAIRLTATTVYSSDHAGWDILPPPESVSLSGCSSPHSFFFSTPLPEGNYKVTVELGGDEQAATTVKAEGRRVMLRQVITAPHETKTESFMVNVRRPQINGGGEVALKRREIGSLDWDDKLTLEFSGQQPSVRALDIQAAPPGVPTIYLAGDSTVVDQDFEPWTGWGQVLTAFFGPKVSIANHAESGETIRSFESEDRFAKIFSLIKPGDYLFLQFGHNDQKPGPGYVSPEMYAAMLRKYVSRARQAGAIPVLVTPMNRRSFDSAGRITDTLAPYPETMRLVASQEHAALIDLNAMSKQLYEAIGETDSRELFVYAPANTYPHQAIALHDDTHFNSFGAWELARCVINGIQQNKLSLARFLRPSLPFSPSDPDSPASVSIPSTPFFDVRKPYER